ncbi:MAG: class I SAM-dependent methyltransferase [Candidatus Korarchaeota archaeon]|nr:class I SAM-dependent methyltransferase [Candidatus Korarchaeota archaeon]
MEDIAEIYDAIAKGFDHTRGRPWPEVDLVEESPVLDLGCGNARHASYLEKRGFEVVCADISWRMLEVAANKFKGERVQCDAARLPFRDGSFATVLYLATLHHLPSREDRLRSLIEIRRVLREGGKAIISVWALFQPRFFSKLPKMLFSLLKGREFGDVYVPWRTRGRTYMRYYHLFTKNELLKLAREAGFSDIRYYKRSFRSKFFAENHVVILRKS